MILFNLYNYVSDNIVIQFDYKNQILFGLIYKFNIYL